MGDCGTKKSEYSHFLGTFEVLMAPSGQLVAALSPSSKFGIKIFKGLEFLSLKIGTENLLREPYKVEVGVEAIGRSYFKSCWIFHLAKGPTTNHSSWIAPSPRNSIYASYAFELRTIVKSFSILPGLFTITLTEMQEEDGNQLAFKTVINREVVQNYSQKTPLKRGKQRRRELKETREINLSWLLAQSHLGCVTIIFYRQRTPGLLSLESSSLSYAKIHYTPDQQIIYLINVSFYNINYFVLSILSNIDIGTFSHCFSARFWLEIFR
jgi:hypothetical protein